MIISLKVTTIPQIETVFTELMTQFINSVYHPEVDYTSHFKLSESLNRLKGEGTQVLQAASQKLKTFQITLFHSY